MPRPAEDRAFIIEAAQRIGTVEADLRETQVGLGRGFSLGDAYWRTVNQQVMWAAHKKDWPRTGFLYREMARYLAHDGKVFLPILKLAVWFQLLSVRESATSNHEFRVVGCLCPACSGGPRSVHAVDVVSIGGRPGELPADFPLPHELCEKGPCPCYVVATEAPGTDP